MAEWLEELEKAHAICDAKIALNISNKKAIEK